eukprot:m.28803 g.28803  ORF g.28803 m.28803 type:complete len:944 (+) comp8035_c0_seq3:264-3095(+)
MASVARFTEEAILHDITAFTRNPKAALHGKRMQSEDFLHNVLQALYSDTLNAETKSYLLEILHEFHEILLEDATQAEHAIASLTAMLDKDDSVSFQADVIVTVTAVMVMHNYPVEQPKTTSTFVDRLLKLLSSRKPNEDGLRRRVCECLSELEMCFPGFLARKFGHLIQHLSEEHSCAAESFAVLVTNVLRNALSQLTNPAATRVTKENETKPESVENLVKTDMEHFTPFYPSGIYTDRPLPYFSDSHMTQESPDIRRAISSLLDTVSILSPAALLDIMHNLTDSAILSSTKAQVFSRMHARLIPTRDTLMQNSLLLLNTRYGDALLSSENRNQMFQQLAMSTKDPFMTPHHKCLLLSWLSCNSSLLPDTKEGILEALETLLPSVFDTVEVMSVKIKTLAVLLRSLKTLDTTQYDNSHFLINSLTCFSDFSSFSAGHIKVRYLFSCLLMLYREGQNDDSQLCQNVYDYVIRILLRFPKFNAHCVHLGESIHRLYPDDKSHKGRTFLIALLERAKNNLADMSDIEWLNNFSHNMYLVDRLGSEAALQPNAYLLRFLRLLRTSRLCVEGNWNTGSTILKACRTLISFQPTAVILKPLGDILRLLWVSFGDIDIRDNARFYYMLLTTVAGQPLHTILEHSSDKGSFSAIMTERLLTSSRYRPADPVEPVNTPFLDLERVEYKEEVTMLSEANSTKSVSLNDYLQKFHSQPAVARLRFQLRYAVNAESGHPSMLYAITISVKKNPKLKIKDAFIPVLTPEEPCVFTLEVEPLDPVPTQVCLSVEYTCPDGRGESMQLPSMPITFESFWVPAVAPNTDSDVPFPSSLFGPLWSSILDETEVPSRENSGLLAPSNKLETILHVPYSPLGNLSCFEFCCQALKQYCVDIDSEQSRCRAVIVLAPRTHILLDCLCFTSDTRVHIATDNFKCLPFFDSTLQTLLGGANESKE